MEQEFPRFYFIPLSRTCAEECRICFRLGCKCSSPRKIHDIDRLLNRAKLGDYNTVVFPASFLFFTENKEVLHKARLLYLRVQVQIHWPVIFAHETRVRELMAAGVDFNFVFDGKENLDWKYFEKLTAHCADWHITFAPRKSAKSMDFLRAIPPSLYKKFYFHFSPYIRGEDILTTKESWALIHKLKRALPDLKVRPPLGRDVWDPRISADLALDSDATPDFSYEVSENPEVSVVIPAFNSGPLLRNVVQHLLAQKIPRTAFEIIIVDDGSSDNSLELIKNFVAPEKGSVNFKYIYFPRQKNRLRGDGNFRAGIARNLGVKHARGRILSFLDSDIIVPTNFLSDLLEKHENWDVIQCVRLHLKSRKRNDLLTHETIHPQKDTYVLESRYWSLFFNTKDWQTIPFFWKYTCTYGLSLKTQDFKAAGWFRKTFVYYGFEDTDLGYRLAKMGKRFFLNPITTYHIDTDEDRTEYKQSNFARHLLLSKTAKIFFLNSLDPAVFSHLISFMGREKNLWDRLHGLSGFSLGALKSKSNLFMPNRRTL